MNMVDDQEIKEEETEEVKKVMQATIKQTQDKPKKGKKNKAAGKEKTEWNN